MYVCFILCWYHGIEYFYYSQVFVPINYNKVILTGPVPLYDECENYPAYICVRSIIGMHIQMKLNWCTFGCC